MRTRSLLTVFPLAVALVASRAQAAEPPMTENITAVITLTTLTASTHSSGYGLSGISITVRGLEGCKRVVKEYAAGKADEYIRKITADCFDTTGKKLLSGNCVPQYDRAKRTNPFCAPELATPNEP